MNELTLEEFAKACKEKETEIFNTSEVAPSLWNKNNYPTTIIFDRYGSTYSGGIWLAFPCLFDHIPDEVEGDDGECSTFWNSYDKAVGKGNTPQEAFDSLKEIMTRKA